MTAKYVCIVYVSTETFKKAPILRVAPRNIKVNFNGEKHDAQK